MDRTPNGPITLHATAVAFGSAALVLTGASGSGKSTLALQLIGLGATLVSDDQVTVTLRDGGLWLSAPAALSNLIEARHFALLACPTAPAWARAVVDMDKVETTRLPKLGKTIVAGVSLPLIRKVESPAFPAMLQLYLKGGAVS